MESIQNPIDLKLSTLSKATQSDHALKLPHQSAVMVSRICVVFFLTLLSHAAAWGAQRAVQRHYLTRGRPLEGSKKGARVPGGKNKKGTASSGGFGSSNAGSSQEVRIDCGASVQRRFS